MVVDARAGRVFDVLADITRHVELDGSGTVLGAPRGPARLFLGAEFTKDMQQHGRRYRSVNRVVDFEEDRRITWETLGMWRGHRIVGGQRWRWTVTPDGDAAAVEHAFLWGFARLSLLTVWLPRYPARARRTMAFSLSGLTAILAQEASTDQPSTRGSRRRPPEAPARTPFPVDCAEDLIGSPMTARPAPAAPDAVSTEVLTGRPLFDATAVNHPLTAAVLRGTLLGMSVVATVAGVLVAARGASAIPGGAQGAASNDSVMRFYSVWWAAQGPTLWRLSRSQDLPCRDLGVACVTTFLGGLAGSHLGVRLGPPQPLFRVLTVTELVLPPAMMALRRRLAAY